MKLNRDYLHLQHIAGELRDGRGASELADLNPWTGETITTFRAASAEDVAEAYRGSAEAQRSWREVNAYQKRAVFEQAVTELQSIHDEVVELIVTELGGTRLKAEFEIGLVIDMLKEAATFPLRMEGYVLPSPIPDRENYLFREPVGVVGVISPFNFPFFLSMKSVAPALGAGNGVVLKPHEDTPITGGTLIAELFAAAGLPAGLLSVVVSDVASIGDAMLTDPVPSVISFTGSSVVGAHIAGKAAAHLKKPILELGGNSAFIVLDDADVDYAVSAAVFSRFTHQGQICMSANRLLVHESLKDEFLEKFVAKVAALELGDPAAPGTIIGPLINDRQADRLASLIDAAIAEGATVYHRGPREGRLIGPVVLGDVTRQMQAGCDEMFGPVVVVETFTDDEEALAKANDSDYGLSGAVHTSNIDRGVQLARRFESGMIHVNDGTIHDEPIVAFGGEKSSGFGRLNGRWSLDEFTTMKWVSVNRGRRQFPYS